MEFSSLDEAVAYIKDAIASSTPELADEMVRIAQQETARQTGNGTWYHNTGAIISCIQPTSVSAEGAEITWTDSGGWFSVYTGEHFYAPAGREYGTSWGVSASNFVDSSFNQIEDEIPNLFKALMKSRGIPIEG